MTMSSVLQKKLSELWVKPATFYSEVQQAATIQELGNNKSQLAIHTQEVHQIKLQIMSNLNPFPNKPLFSGVCSTNLLKAQWKKEKLPLPKNPKFNSLPHNHNF